MRKLIFFVLIAMFSVYAFGQTKAEMPGIWKSTVKAGNKPTTPTYMLLKDDGTFKGNVDTSGNEITGTTPWTGKWDLTSENELKFMPDDATAEIRYYTPLGNDMLYRYTLVEKDGVKTKVHMLEMDFYLQKMK